MISVNAKHVLEMSFNDLEKYCDKHKTSLQDLEQELNLICTEAARMAEYIATRRCGGYGDQGHEKAVKSSAKRLKAVRKALGYSYP